MKFFFLLAFVLGITLKADMPKRHIQKYLDNIQLFTQEKVIGSNYTKQVETGQNAKVLVIGCSDSLVDPALMMNVEPNEVFMHRNIAAIVPDYETKNTCSAEPNATGAVLEYAVNHLEVTDIIVMGHGHCGGIKALLKGFKPVDPQHTFIEPWIKEVEKAKSELAAEGVDLKQPAALHALEQRTIRHSIEHLMTYPWIAKRVADNTLRLHGVHYDRGTLSWLNPATKTFEVLFKPEKVEADES